ncbi:hypothetical protein CGU37_28405 [Pseudomonas fluorescens]|nr:hypothetical protein CGU37_28405 [Pseudomonas fluorescens]
MKDADLAFSTLLMRGFLWDVSCSLRRIASMRSLIRFENWFTQNSLRLEWWQAHATERAATYLFLICRIKLFMFWNLVAT